MRHRTGATRAGLLTAAVLVSGLIVPHSSWADGPPASQYTLVIPAGIGVPLALNNSDTIESYTFSGGDLNSSCSPAKPATWHAGAITTYSSLPPVVDGTNCFDLGALNDAGGLAGFDSVYQPDSDYYGASDTQVYSPGSTSPTVQLSDPPDSVDLSGMNAAGDVGLTHIPAHDADENYPHWSEYRGEITGPYGSGLRSVPGTEEILGMATSSFDALTSGSPYGGGSYAVGDLSTLALTPLTFTPQAIASNGTIAGISSANGVVRSPDGTLTTGLPVDPFAVNSSGSIVGEDLKTNAYVLLTAGSTTEVPIASFFPSGWTSIDARFINDHGDIAGTAYNPNGQEVPFLLQNSRVPPVVNSTGDAAAATPSSGSCDTGSTVTNAQGQSVPECTLRAALQAENSGSATTKTVTFDLAADNLGLFPKSPLPPITAAGVTVDGTTAPGGAVAVDGSALSATDACVEVQAGQVKLAGLEVSGCPGDAVLLNSSAGHDTVTASTLGNLLSTVANPGIGVDIRNSPGNVIGGPVVADRDVISGDFLGVYIHGAGSTGNDVAGDYIGVKSDGSTEDPDGSGVLVVDASGTTVGGATSRAGTGAGNVVDSGHDGKDGDVAVYGISAAVTGTVIEGNTVGLAADGTTSLSTTCASAVSLEGTVTGAVIGGSPGRGNVLDGACQRQVLVDSTKATRNQVVGNRLGTDASGDHDLASFNTSGDQAGVVVTGATHTTVGVVGDGNVFEDGLTPAVETVPTTVEASLLYPTTVAVPGSNTALKGPSDTSISGNRVNVYDGSTLSSQPSGIGMTAGGDGDVISHNDIAESVLGIDAIKATGPETIQGNHVGVDSSGSRALLGGYDVVIDTSPKSVVTGNTLLGAKAGLTIGDSSDALVTDNHIGVASSGDGRLQPYKGPVPPKWKAAAGAATGKAFGVIVGHSDSVKLHGNVIGRLDGVGVKVEKSKKVQLGAELTGSKHDHVKDDGDGNVIFHNSAEGVQLLDAHATLILSNRIYDNGKGAIATGSGFSGPDTPELREARNTGKHTQVTVGGNIAARYGVVQLYRAESCGDDPQLDKLLGSEVPETAGPGHVTVAVDTQAVGTHVVATYTLDEFGTSRVTKCVTVKPKKDKK